MMCIFEENYFIRLNNFNKICYTVILIKKAFQSKHKITHAIKHVCDKIYYINNLLEEFCEIVCNCLI